MKDSLFRQHIFNSLIQSKSILFFSINAQLCLNHFSKKFEMEFLLSETEAQNKNLSLQEIPEFKRLNAAFLSELPILMQKSIQPGELWTIFTPQFSYQIELQAVKSEGGDTESLIFLGINETRNEIIEQSTEALSSDFNLLLDTAGDGILIGDKQGHIINLNNKISELTGYTREEILDKHISFLFNNGNLESDPLQFDELAKGHELLKERYIQHKNGSKAPVEMLSKKITTGYISILRDISERIETQLSLKEITDRLLYVTKMERIGIIDLDLMIDQMTINKEMSSILSNQKVETLDDWYQNIHPDDVFRVKEGIELAINTGSIFEFVYRLRKKTKTYKTIKASANIYKDNKYERKLIISSVDITDSSITRAQLREQEQTFKALTNSATAAILIYNDSFLYVNHSFERITGYTTEEAKKLNFWTIIHPDHQEMVKQRGQERISGRIVTSRYEFKIITKSGEEKWIDYAASQINYLGQTAAIGSAFDITERKELEIQLKSNINKLENERIKTQNSENRFRDYIDQNSAVMMAVDPKTKKVIFANQAATKLYGYTKEEFLKLTAYDINPLPKKEIDKIVNDALMVNSNEFQLLHKTKEGKTINVQINASPVISNNQTQMVLIIHDKTDEISSKSKLKESHNTYRNIINSISEMIYILDENNRFLFVNNAAIHKYGYALEDFIGNTPEFLSAPGKNDMKEVLEKLKKAYEGEQNIIEFWGMRRSKEVFPKEVALSPGYYFGQKAVIAVSRDISETKKITNELIQAKERAEQSDQLKSAFLANMSHEIRTPMNAILGFTDLIRDPEMDNEERYRFLNIIHRSSHHLLHLINDLIDISKIYSNQMSITKTSFQLNTLLYEIFEYFEVELTNQNKEKSIEFQITFGLPYGEDEIITDETRLRQILNNIIGNAIKFTRKGMVSIVYQLIDDYLIFTIKDTGIGISNQQKDLIFDRFSQADSTISREFGGTGLGLAISKACTELLGGKIWMKSVLGQGTEMKFSIPYQKTEEQ